MQRKIRILFVACIWLIAFRTQGAFRDFRFGEIVRYNGAGYDLRGLEPACKIRYCALTLLPEGPEKERKLAVFFGNLQPFATHCKGGDDPEWKDCEWEGDDTWGGRRHQWGGACECGSYDPSNPTDDPRVWEKELQDFNSARVCFEILLSDSKELSEKKKKDEAASEKAVTVLKEQLEGEQIVSKLIEAYQTICALRDDIEIEELLKMVKGDFQVADYKALSDVVNSIVTQEMGIALLKLRMRKKE